MATSQHPGPQFLPATAAQCPASRAGRLSRRVSLAIILGTSIAGWWGIIHLVQWLLVP